MQKLQSEYDSQSYIRLKNYFESINATDDKIKNSIMDFCSKLGDINLLKKLYDQGYTCTTNAIDWAAGKGHYDIVVWLIGIQQECTYNAIDNAAAHGYIEIVSFLYLNGKPFTKRSLNGAILGNPIKMLNKAMKYNKTEIIEYIYSKIVYLN